MATRFENGIVVTLEEKNRVLWNATVVTDGEKIAAVGNSGELKRRYPEAEGRLLWEDHPAGFHLHSSPLLLDYGARDEHSRRAR